MARRWALSALIAASLSGCGAAYDSDRFWNDATFWEEGKSSEAAMAALGKGDFIKAEELATDAMRRNPKDPYAILALGVVYENTARPDLARQYFQSLASMNPQDTALVGVGPAGERRTIGDIARQHLAALAARPKGGYQAPPSEPPQLNVPPPPGFTPGEIGSPDDANIILRFQTLRRLLDEGLITRDEYNLRRGANLGALLPYTSAPPAIGLGRPAPAPDQLVHRLRYLAVAFEQKEISG
ncbi:MAG TPA: tetratricopeptide repeat protein, partial [Rhodospirillaceae bacterium]|nr:tetratricopeptide repeat protein [Rhodospirillaceae bacterium]